MRAFHIDSIGGPQPDEHRATSENQQEEVVDRLPIFSLRLISDHADLEFISPFRSSSLPLPLDMSLVVKMLQSFLAELAFK